MALRSRPTVSDVGSTSAAPSDSRAASRSDAGVRPQLRVREKLRRQADGTALTAFRRECGRVQLIAGEIQGTARPEGAWDLQALDEVRQIGNGPERPQPSTGGAVDADLLGQPNERRIDLELKERRARGRAAESRRPPIENHCREAHRRRRFGNERARDAGADDDHVGPHRRGKCACREGGFGVVRPNRHAAVEIANLCDKVGQAASDRGCARSRIIQTARSCRRSPSLRPRSNETAKLTVVVSIGSNRARWRIGTQCFGQVLG